MSEPTPNGGAGTPPANDNGGAPTAGARVTFTEEQQAKIEEIKAGLLNDFKKSKDFKELQDLAKQAQTLLKEKQEQEQANLSEVERLRQKVSDFEQVSTKLTHYEEFISKEFESLVSELSDEERPVIDGLSVPVTEKIALTKLMLSKKSNGTVQNGPARAGNPASKGSDPLLEKVKQEAEIYCKGKTDEYKQKFIENRYATLKAGADGQKFAGLE